MSESIGNAEEVNEATITNRKINLDLKLYDPGDSIEYNLTVKNDSDEDFYFDENSLKLNTDYLEYVFEYEDNSNVIKAGSEKVVKLRIDYKNKVPAEVLENEAFNATDNMTVSLSNENTIKNPKTGDYLYSNLLGLIIIGGMIILLLKSKKTKTAISLMIGLSIIPISVYAVCKTDIVMESKIEIDGKEAYFLTGPEVNAKMKKLAVNGASTNGITYYSDDQHIISILESETAPAESNKNEENTVSKPDSPYPIYMWFDNGTIYWWSEDKTPSIQEDSSYMLNKMYNLSTAKAVMRSLKRKENHH